MKKSLLFAALCLVSSLAYASPFVVSDPSSQTVTHCGVILDDGVKYDVPVMGKACKIDISTVSVGSHTLKATFVNIDPIWGRSESVTSAPLNFVRPPNTIYTAPVNLIITP